jgi:hypothetical protein
MDFIYSLKQFDKLWSFNKYVFSIGTYEGSSFKQLLFPLIKNDNTLIFAIDEKYNLMDLDVNSIEIDGLKYINISKQIKLTAFYNKEFNNMIFFIPENVRSSYYKIGITHFDFMYTLECKPVTNDWFIFERFLLELVEKNKNIYINNWVFFNTRYFEEVNHKMLYRYRDTGHYFEYFPELGNIIYNTYKMYPDSKIYITLQNKIKHIDSIFKNIE